MIWFNDEGTENGGFGFTGSRCDTGTSDLRDKFGKSRLRLVVDSLGAAHIDFLDATGRVTNSLTGADSRSGNR